MPGAGDIPAGDREGLGHGKDSSGDMRTCVQDHAPEGVRCAWRTIAATLGRRPRGKMCGTTVSVWGGGVGGVPNKVGVLCSTTGVQCKVFRMTCLLTEGSSGGSQCASVSSVWVCAWVG